MTKRLTSSGGRGATALITHRVRAGRHADYERWIGEIAPLSKASPGNLDWHIVRPVPGRSETYTVVIRFDTEAHLQEWLQSPARARLIEKARPLFVDGDRFSVNGGLDFWFAPAAPANVPVRWKQFLATWSAIYPLVLGVPLLVAPVLRHLGVADGRPLTTLVASGIVVFLMTYLVMPRYTRLLHRWLFT